MTSYSELFPNSGDKWWKDARCKDDPWFTSDKIPAAERRRMKEICAQCPGLAGCLKEATSMTTTAGFWAGKSFNVYGGTRDPEPAVREETVDERR